MWIIIDTNVHYRKESHHMAKRVFLVVLDSFGIGGASDASLFKDEGSNTLAAVCIDDSLNLPNLAKMGLFDITGHEDQRIKDHLKKTSYPSPIGSYGRLIELSMGKDTTIGHWEIAGVLSDKPMPTYPNGFPQEILDKLKEETGRDILCNKPYSGTEVINDYGDEHVKTGALIVYTSADSVLQIAAHEDVIPVPELYSICEKARAIMTGEHAVGRIIARPFIGTSGNYQRTSNRHDFSLTPPSSTMLDMLKESLGDNGLQILSFRKTTEYDGEEWFGDLDEAGMTNEQTYLIETAASCTVQLQGTPANPANHPITIMPGWNWIGFPNPEPLDVAEALADFEAGEGDQILSLNRTTEYDGEEWFGDLIILIPGQGFMYYSSSDEPKTLIFKTN